MKLAAAVVLICILATVLIFFVAAMALSATRRARLRGEKKGEMDFSDSETVQFSKELLEAQRRRQEEEDSL
ncbi:MAG TPA: hypothetical protein VHB20_08255 [Verrucomicrobiae bacterium]|jgi:hypothetical protein|nr:hypothetical protein [Verrucomicrobiae bacterium]